MFKNKTIHNKIFRNITVFVFGLSLLLTTSSVALAGPSINETKIHFNSSNLSTLFAQVIPGAPKDDDAVKGFTRNKLDENPIIVWLNAFVNLLAGVVGVGAILMIVWGGIQYITARDNAQAVQSAKEKIINVVIGLAAFIFLYAFLQWLIPGGIFA